VRILRRLLPHVVLPESSAQPLSKRCQSTYSQCKTQNIQRRKIHGRENQLVKGSLNYNRGEK
jgi:hypothetical protein